MHKRGGAMHRSGARAIPAADAGAKLSIAKRPGLDVYII